jgi:hypothetical protein
MTTLADQKKGKCHYRRVREDVVVKVLQIS